MAGRFVLHSDEEMNEFFRRLGNENIGGYFVFSMKPTRVVVKLDYLKTQLNRQCQITGLQIIKRILHDGSKI